MRAEQPQPDPKLIEVQTKAQLKQMEMQQSQQLQAAQFEHTKAMDTQQLEHRQALAELDKNLMAQREAMKIESDERIAEIRIASERAAAMDRMEMEKELAVWKATRQFEIDEKKTAMMAKSNAASGSDSGISKARPGGRLDR